MRFGNLATVKIALGRGGAWRRHVPPALYLVGLTVILIAVARPAALLLTATARATVILAMDVSGSMSNPDIKPSRIEAAQDAAKEFINTQPKEIAIGIVAFAGTAQLVQAPTDDHQALIAAVDLFQLQRGTAVGSGMLTSIATLFPGEEYGEMKGVDVFSQGSGSGNAFGGGVAPSSVPLGAVGGDTGRNPTMKKAEPVEPGSLKTAIVILMTDGNTRQGPDPVEVARIAADHGLRVFTIGFGSKTQTGAAPIGGGFGGGMRASLNEEPLKAIADITRSKYYFAGSADELKNIYSTLSKQRIVELKETEVTAYVAGFSAIFFLLAATLSMLWFNRLY
jgi:Ca-activated chloride channel family protein